MNYIYECYHNSSSDDETDTDFSGEISQTYKNKRSVTIRLFQKSFTSNIYLTPITPTP